MTSTPAWNAEGAGAAVSVTFDNLGEAAELELGLWPADQPLGQHFTVKEILPRLLEMLSSLSLSATFFVEGLNAEVYPDTLRSLADRGHEVAAHAWRHEEWASLDLETETRLLSRATAAMKAAGLAPSGFRPPGGGLTTSTLGLLAEEGYRYASPAGEKEGIRGGLAVLPFRWPLVDAYSFMPQFAGLREQFSGSSEPVAPDQMSRVMRGSLTEHAKQGGHLALLFHPFAVAVTGEPGWTALQEILTAAVELADDGLVGLMRMDEAAHWMLDHPADFGHEPRLDDATWMAQSN
jgi:peptidoglycan/xylan/chitin deacetylase (PgdA/CDA1 family)